MIDVADSAVDSLATIVGCRFAQVKTIRRCRHRPQKGEVNGVRGRSRIEELPNGLLLNRTGKLYTAGGLPSDSSALASVYFAKCSSTASGAAVEYLRGGVDDASQQVPGVVVVIKRCRDKWRGLTGPQ